MADIDCTCSALRRAARRLSQSYDTALAPEGLGVSQYAVLGTLAKRSGEAPTVGELAERLGLDRTTLAHNLRPLERDGFIRLTADRSDGRLRRVVLTEAGRDKRERCLPLWRSAQDGFEARFGAESASALRASLALVAERALPPSPSPGA
jgi:DNA-binding MarR family transcriptional regulator